MVPLSLTYTHVRTLWPHRLSLMHACTYAFVHRVALILSHNHTHHLPHVHTHIYSLTHTCYHTLAFSLSLSIYLSLPPLSFPLSHSHKLARRHAYLHPPFIRILTLGLIIIHDPHNRINPTPIPIPHRLALHHSSVTLLPVLDTLIIFSFVTGACRRATQPYTMELLAIANP